MLSEIESHHGRTRDCKKFRARSSRLDSIWRPGSPRKLALPRDDITRYAFVLEPLAEIAPNRKHPILGESYAELWAKFDRTGVKQRRLGSVSDIS